MKFFRVWRRLDVYFEVEAETGKEAIEKAEQCAIEDYDGESENCVYNIERIFDDGNTIELDLDNPDEKIDD